MSADNQSMLSAYAQLVKNYVPETRRLDDEFKIVKQGILQERDPKVLKDLLTSFDTELAGVLVKERRLRRRIFLKMRELKEIEQRRRNLEAAIELIRERLKESKYGW